ncbi:ubiquitin carboxyl-terminal hydrolase 22-like [Iris pallida]|uniref:Ubiquitin carboxyl-terminal hydrolase n=1 Tax=Iris pallida TaxID=29817 RepID=A0AAX6DWA7_IRIPA|nr:ubiquitin carboxyl-terminal hydrolase 22-like [Iris pallida]KAJ6796037.1 ubiquitin carboxyl-terminal hydrolase 22-like [Iris pallida]
MSQQRRRRRLLLPPPAPCPHLSDYRSNAHGLSRPFLSLSCCVRVLPPGFRAEILRDPHEIPRCALCFSCDAATGADSFLLSSVPRLFACLACAAVSCPLHAPAHAAASLGHEIAVDVDRAELFCCACRDQVYDPDFDSAVLLSSPSVAVKKRTTRRRKNGAASDYLPWTPDPAECAAIQKGSRPLLPPDNGGGATPLGLRGMNNLGNTCFMSSVLQALLHTPPLRDYFLSDLHNRFVCRQKGRKKRSANGSVNANAGGDPRLCLSCELDEMYSFVFSGDRTPYSPAKFLYSWWQHASNLASYTQQDAHEFFISMLDGIHEKVEEDQFRAQNESNGDCCIAHRIFSGILRSDVTCTICGFTSTTYDPCVDISLDLDSVQNSTKVAPSKSGAGNSDTVSMLSSQSYGISTLTGCLDRFTKPERLGSDEKFFCQQCQVKQESLKQMSIRKLPLVACFHIKRFEHSSTRKMSRKIDRYLQFPFFLDMARYLSSAILRSRYGNRIYTFDSDDFDAVSETASEFELFAVITHSGNLEAGHYITYLRLNNQWYRCNDSWITHVTENMVRSSQAYMLFYVKKMLYYKASEDVVAP